MSIRYLDLSGAVNFWTNIKNYILSKIPTKTSELTNDSGFLTQHQSLSNYVTLNSEQTIPGKKLFTASAIQLDNVTSMYGSTMFIDTSASAPRGEFPAETHRVGRIYIGDGQSYNGAWFIVDPIIDTNRACYRMVTTNPDNTDSTRFSIVWDSTKEGVRRRKNVSQGDLLPSGNNIYNLGADDLKWDIGYIHNLIGSNKENASEDANNYYSTTSGSHMTFYTTTNGGTKLSNVPAAVNTHLESRTIRYLSASDWNVEQICHNTNGLYYRKGTNNGWSDWKTFAFTDSNITGKASNVTGTVAIANGGTGATTRLNAVKALTNEAVSSPTHFLAITTNWGKAGYTTVAQAKTVLGITGDMGSHSDSEYVHKTGNETISGIKTISTHLRFSSANTRGTAPSADETRNLIDYKDSAGNRISLFETMYYTDKSSKTSIYAYKTTAATGGNIGSIGIGCDASGNVYTYAPTPATADNSTQIATTAFVKAQGYITGSGNTTGSSGSCTGNAATATQFSANTTVALTGDATGTSAGSKKGWSVPVTLANSGVTAGSYGPSANASPSHGGTFSVPYVTVDAKGRVTAASTKTITLPADSNTDTKVTQTVTTGNSTYPVLLCATANATTTGTTTSRFSEGLTVNARYSSIYITNKYDTANTKGVRNTSSYNNGILFFRSYDETEMGTIRCESSKNGYQQTYMQARSYIKNGAISPEGTATTCYITVRVRDNGSKTIYTDGSWENSLTPYANETYDLGTSSLRWLRCYCKNFYGSYVDIAGRYIGDEYSTNARTCLYLKSNRDTDGQSGIYFSKFRQNRAQGALTGSDLVDLSLDVLENSVRTNSCISISFRYFENDVPTKIYVIPKKSATSYMGTADNPWTNAYITNLNLNGNAFDPTSIDGIGTVKLLAYIPANTQEYTLNAGTTKAGSSLGEVWASYSSSSTPRIQWGLNMARTQSGTWKLLNYTGVVNAPSDLNLIGLWVRIA